MGNVDCKRNKPYFQQAWNCFDAVMLLFIWFSLGLQCIEFYVTFYCSQKHVICSIDPTKWVQYEYLAIIRCPRPIILVRVFRAVLRLQLPQARVKAIFQ